MGKLSGLITILSAASICLLIVFGPGLLYPFLVFLLTANVSLTCFLFAIFAGAIVYVLARKHLIFRTEEKEETGATR